MNQISSSHHTKHNHAEQLNLNKQLLTALAEALDAHNSSVGKRIYALFQQGALVAPNDSLYFLSLIYSDKMPKTVRSACYAHLESLFQHGLDVDGKHDGGNSNILTAHFCEPNVVRRALAQGADPFIKPTTRNLDPVQCITQLLQNQALTQEQRNAARQSIQHIHNAQSNPASYALILRSHPQQVHSHSGH
jgi:hypothetical protein